jgi:aminotransferase in exopolysaccharide biosynthesis
VKDSFHIEFVEFVQNLFSTRDFVPLHAPRFEGNEQRYVKDAIDSTYVSSVGKYVDEFENRIIEYTGAKFAVATVNGTSALHIALKLSGIKKDDEVITQATTFVATCNAISYSGAVPVFVDIEDTTFGLCPIKLDEFLEEFTEIRDDGLCWNKESNRIVRACVPVHILGHPARVDMIREVCNKNNIILVEDAAEALGTKYKNKHVGRTGKFGIFSFNGNKIISTGGGGMVVTEDKCLAESAKHWTTTSKVPHEWEYYHDQIGYNYRMPNVNAALGCGQMEVLGNYVRRKRRLATNYMDWFKEKGMVSIVEPRHARSNYWLNAVVLNSLEERNKFLSYTNSHGVMTRPLWVPMHRLSIYMNCARGKLENTEWLSDRVVTIPSGII